MQRTDLLILDFDGVICDSLPECFVSSWYAYHELRSGASPFSIPRDAFERFSTMRPFIRSGEDYLLIQSLLETGATVSGQPQFDGLLARAGQETMGRYKTLLYQARDRLIEAVPDYWYALNHVYPHMRAGMGGLRDATDVYILSTKKASFIARILVASGIEFPEANILYSGSRSKVEMIRELLAATGSTRAVFVDDQVDHFAGAHAMPAGSGSVECRLATWGYVKAEWLAESADYRIIEPPEAKKLLESYAGSRAP